MSRQRQLERKTAAVIVAHSYFAAFVCAAIHGTHAHTRPRSKPAIGAQAHHFRREGFCGSGHVERESRAHPKGAPVRVGCFGSFGRTRLRGAPTGTGRTGETTILLYTSIESTRGSTSSRTKRFGRSKSRRAVCLTMYKLHSWCVCNGNNDEVRRHSSVMALGRYGMVPYRDTEMARLFDAVPVLNIDNAVRPLHSFSNAARQRNTRRINKRRPLGRRLAKTFQLRLGGETDSLYEIGHVAKTGQKKSSSEKI